MQLYTVRGGNKEDALSKKYTLGIGISLGNKWFSTDNTLALIEWALEHTKDIVIVYVADAIHAINLEVRNGINSARALNIARRKGQTILEEIRNEIEKRGLPQDRILYATWEDMYEPPFIEKVQWMRAFYERSSDFQSRIHTIVRDYSSNEERQFSDEEVHKLGLYIVEESPEMIAKVPIKGVIFDANVYPFDSETVRFFENIQKGLEFPEIKEKLLDIGPKVFLEVH
ncbi:MAG: tRNA-dependent cyclodipeptide synthase [Patescibacteria group bacterium]